MFEQKKQKAFWLRFSVSTIILASIAILPGCKKQPAEKSQTEQTSSESKQSEPVAQITGESATIDVTPSTGPKAGLNDIIQAARTWGPAFTPWYGKPAPDFALTGLDGKEHKLKRLQG